MYVLEYVDGTMIHDVTLIALRQSAVDNKLLQIVELLLARRLRTYNVPLLLLPFVNPQGDCHGVYFFFWGGEGEEFRHIKRKPSEIAQLEHKAQWREIGSTRTIC